MLISYRGGKVGLPSIRIQGNFETIKRVKKGDISSPKAPQPVFLIFSVSSRTSQFDALRPCASLNFTSSSSFLTAPTHPYLRARRPFQWRNFTRGQVTVAVPLEHTPPAANLLARTALPEPIPKVRYFPLGSALRPVVKLFYSRIRSNPLPPSTAWLLCSQARTEHRNSLFPWNLQHEPGLNRLSELPPWAHVPEQLYVRPPEMLSGTLLYWRRERLPHLPCWLVQQYSRRH